MKIMRKVRFFGVGGVFNTLKASYVFFKDFELKEFSLIFFASNINKRQTLLRIVSENATLVVFFTKYGNHDIPSYILKFCLLKKTFKVVLKKGRVCHEIHVLLNLRKTI